jgi:hypothetical protein
VDKLEFAAGALGALFHDSPSLSPFLCRFNCDEFWSDDRLDQKRNFVHNPVPEGSVDSGVYDNPGAEEGRAQARKQ